MSGLIKHTLKDLCLYKDNSTSENISFSRWLEIDKTTIESQLMYKEPNYSDMQKALDAAECLLLNNQIRLGKGFNGFKDYVLRRKGEGL